MNVLEARRRMLGAGVYKKTVTGNPAVAQGSLARMYPGIEMQGWSKQDGTPTPENPVPIVSAGNWNEETQKWEYEVGVGVAQLFDISKVITEESAVINNGDGTLTVKTTVTSNGVAAKSPHRLRDYCPDIVPRKTYYLYADSTGSEKFIYFSKSKFVWDFGSGRTITDDDLDSVVYFYASGLSTEATVSNIMITEVNNAPHEPYKQPQTVTLTSDRPLTKWDRLTKKDGVWGWEYGSAEVVFDGSENWLLYPASDVGIIFYTNLPDTSLGLQTSLCDKYRNINDAWDSNYNGVFGIYGDNAVVTNKYFRPPSAAVETVEQFKTWLSENPLTLWYETAEETFTPLSTSEQEQMNALHTNRPTTVLSNDAGCEMALTYKTKKSLEVTT